MSKKSKLLTVEEAAKLANVSTRTIYRRMNSSNCKGTSIPKTKRKKKSTILYEVEVKCPRVEYVYQILTVKATSKKEAKKRAEKLFLDSLKNKENSIKVGGWDFVAEDDDDADYLAGDTSKYEIGDIDELDADYERC